MQTAVNSSLIYNCQIFRAIKMSFSKWIDKQLWYIHRMEYYSLIKEMNYHAMKRHVGNLNKYF